MKRSIGFLVIILSICAFLFGATHTPTGTITTGLDGTWQTICELGHASRYPNIVFHVSNTGANPFTDCKVQTYKGPGAGDYTDYAAAWTACQSLVAAGSTEWEIAGAAKRKLRVQVKSTLGTDAYCLVTANGP